MMAMIRSVALWEMRRSLPHPLPWRGQHVALYRLHAAHSGQNNVINGTATRTTITSSNSPMRQ